MPSNHTTTLSPLTPHAILGTQRDNTARRIL